MKYPCIALLGVALLGNSGPALAEIYKTTDADGNTIYTDRPANPRHANEVEIGPTNISDAPGTSGNDLPEENAGETPDEPDPDWWPEDEDEGEEP